MNRGMRIGTLFIVSTPIGNLEDISVRAVGCLSDVDLIAAEDTRKTKILLDRYLIKKPLTSYFSYNENERTPVLIEKLKNGKNIALVSDAGTPGISDPSSKIIKAAIKEKIPIVTIPGPTAILPALISSGISADRFVFVGFLPVKKRRKVILKDFQNEKRTLVLYESPHRLLRTLNDLRTYLGDRHISVSRELTKKFEKIHRGKISEQIDCFSKQIPRGEFVLVVEGSS